MPRALAGLTFRDELLPSADWCKLYARLTTALPVAEACKRFVRALALADRQAHFATTPSHMIAFPRVTQHEIASYDYLEPSVPVTEMRCHA
ncbi:hypothetical protein ACGTNG_17795 [Halomonas sp. 1390]|uniref:hypothetical protein n=1 Tax=Halomonas sp. B23F22_3 TaxID=3459516 RepID=UPI00373E9131